MKPLPDASQTMLAHPRTTSFESEPPAWMLDRRTLLRRHGRAVTLGIALRHIQAARTQSKVLAMIEEILVHHVGVEAFAVEDTTPGATRPYASHGVFSRATAASPITRVPFGAGDTPLGALAIYRLVPWKSALDPADHELLAALGPQIAIALQVARFVAARPTVRPPQMRPEKA